MYNVQRNASLIASSLMSSQQDSSKIMDVVMLVNESPQGIMQCARHIATLKPQGELTTETSIVNQTKERKENRKAKIKQQLAS